MYWARIISLPPGPRAAESTVVYSHALRNALLPVITLLGLSVPGLIGGSVIFESIFSIPGMGQLFYQGVMARDYPLVMGILVIGAVLTLLVTSWRIWVTLWPTPAFATGGVLHDHQARQLFARRYMAVVLGESLCCHRRRWWLLIMFTVSFMAPL